MQGTRKYPHFMADKPVGRDCFEGRSQERLAHIVCDYMRDVDANSEENGLDVNAMPRIIGLEGSWGSGKSNMVRMIEHELADEGYYTFTYDAWGHQEDLQRRSILETMTSHLIGHKVLHGKVKIQMRNGKMNYDTWENQLSLLLSNKTTTVKKSMPKLSGAAVWGIFLVSAFAVLTVISGVLLDYVFCFPVWVAILLDLMPLIFGCCLIFYYRCKDKNWDRTRELITQRDDETIAEEYTSSEEPSVTEFKNWMQAVSNHLGSVENKYNRLVIVIDNMDRLPSEKVLQLWSSIYTFFAGDQFDRIWAIIPYDYKHLCQAIYGSGTGEDSKSEDVERIKQFISKTFPITYRVPEPVITDYRKLFFTYFDEAFGPDAHDREHICQVFMRLKEQPNPRTVIRFVNELVAMRLQWNDTKYRLRNQALYILKQDYLHYDKPHLNAQLLSDGLFDKIDAFYPDKEKVRTELCQYAYGLEDEKLAEELPLRKELKRMMLAGESIAGYVDKPNFLTVLENLINDSDQESINNVVRSMASLDHADVPQEIKDRLQTKWDFLANMKAESRYDSHQYDDTLTILIHHATQKRVTNMAKKYAKAMQRITVNDGAAYFKAQHKLQDVLKAARLEFDDSDWYHKINCEPEVFVEYICEAKAKYDHYGLTTELKELNDYLYEGVVSGCSSVATVVNYIKDDKNYDLADLKKELEKAISENNIDQSICVAAYVHRVLSNDQGVMTVRFKPETITTYLHSSKVPWEDNLPVGMEDVIAMSLADGKDLNEIDDQMLPRICECMDRYFNYTELLKHSGKEGSAFRKLNIYCVINHKGGLLNTVYAAGHLVELQKALALEPVQLLEHFNRWPSIDWGEINVDNEYVKDVKNYVHQSFFEDYRDYPGCFSDSVIRLGVGALNLQQTGFLAKVQQVQQTYNWVAKLMIDPYWKGFVTTFLGTDYMKDSGVLLTNECVTMLKWLYEHNEVVAPDLLDVILRHGEGTTLKEYLHPMMNNYFAKADINKVKFLWFGNLLPMLGSDMDSNTARGLITHFIKPVCKDAECATIIVEYKSFYVEILRKDRDIAAPIINEMVCLKEYMTVKAELEALLPKVNDAK